MDYFKREQIREKEYLRIAKNSTTSEARIPAFRYLAGNDDAYEIFIDGLNHVHVGIVDAAIYGIAAFDDSRWEILIDLLEDEDFGYAKEILRNIRTCEKDLSNHIERLRNIISPRKDAYDLLSVLSGGFWDDDVDYSKVCDAIARDCSKYHDIWAYGNHRFIRHLDMNHPLSVNLVKRELLNDDILYPFDRIIQSATDVASNGYDKTELGNVDRKLYSYLSTLISLSNKYRMVNDSFDLHARINYLQYPNHFKTASKLLESLELYHQGKINSSAFGNVQAHDED